MPCSNSTTANQSKISIEKSRELARKEIDRRIRTNLPAILAANRALQRQGQATTIHVVVCQHHLPATGATDEAVCYAQVVQVEPSAPYVDNRYHHCREQADGESSSAGAGRLQEVAAKTQTRTGSSTSSVGGGSTAVEAGCCERNKCVRVVFCAVVVLLVIVLELFYYAEVAPNKDL